MKKTLIAAAAAVALTASAAAEITFGSWGRAIAVPLASNGEDTVAGQTMSWGGYGRATGLTFRGDSDGVAGFTMDVRATTSAALDNPGDAHFWVKPVEQVKLTIGKVDFGPFKSAPCFGSWDFIRPSFAKGDDMIFKGVARSGMLVEVAPTDALYAYVQVPMTTAFAKAEDAYKNTQVGVSYALDGIGKIKVQFDGKGASETSSSDANTDCDIIAGFDLTAVENLFVTAGFTYHNNATGAKTKYLDNSDDAKNRKTMDVAAGLTYKINEDFSVAANAMISMYDSADMGIEFGAGASYNVGDGLSVSADVRGTTERKTYSSGNKVKTQEQQIAIFAGLNKQIGAASLGFGFQMVTNCVKNSGLQDLKVPATETGKKTVWAVPVVITAAF